MAASPAIDWDTAQRVGELLAGSPPAGGVRARSVQPLAHDFARRVADYTGLAVPAELPPLETVDRPAWIAANLTTMRPLMDSLTETLSLGEGSQGKGQVKGMGKGSGARAPKSAPRSFAGAVELVLSSSFQAASGHLLGAQFGAVTGLLSQRVLGQYDISLLDPDATPRLLLVAPNLAAASSKLGVKRGELVTWVAIHEITHAVQFSGAPWLREHLAGMIRELIAGLEAPLDPSAAAKGSSSRSRLPVPTDLLSRARGGELRTLIERARRGELLRLTLGEDRWRLVERMQATMSLIEGHAEHTMDAVGAEFLPSLPRLRAAMNRRRGSRGLPWRVLERLLGLELKMRQYEVGRRFCDAVVRDAGPQALALAWESAAKLPSTDELEHPERWLQRMQIAA
jgi:putative hydrolase